MFQPGQSGNPAGKPKGCVGGRSRALKVLDDMLAQEENLAALEEALKAELHKNPIRFFRTIVMPLLPRDARVEIDQASTVQWTSLLSLCAASPSVPEVPSAEDEDLCATR